MAPVTYGVRLDRARRNRRVERRRSLGRDGTGRSLIDLVGLWQDLEDLLGTHVDVLSDGGVSPYLRERIYADAVSL